MRYGQSYQGGGHSGYGGRAGWDMGPEPGGWRGGYSAAERGGWGGGYMESAAGGQLQGYGGTGVDRDWRTGRHMGGGPAVERVRASHIMTRHPETVTPDTPLSDVAARMRDLDVGIIPVVTGDGDSRLQGVITDRDIVVRAAAEGKDLKKEKVRDHMTGDVGVVGMNSNVREVFSVMKRERVRRVPVVDGENRLVGIIAQADLAVDYAGLDLQRETEVEEVIERISEPARPDWSGRRPHWRQAEYDEGFIDRVGRGFRQSGIREWVPEVGDRAREGWDAVRRGARHLMDRGYDRGWR